MAQNNLGAMYDKGHGVAQNHSLAAKWYLAAARQGEPTAQYNIGTLYSNGLGILQDYKRAHIWLNIAAAQGIGNAVAVRNLVERKMSVSQIEAAQQMAQRCLNSSYKQYEE